MNLELFFKDVNTLCGNYLLLIIDYLLAFVGFRVLDIFKPFPVNYFDKIKNSFGVLLDDLVAGSIIAIFFLIYYETF